MQLIKHFFSKFFYRITRKKMEHNSTNNNNDGYQEVKLVRIREYELPALKLPVVIYVKNDGNVVELRKDPEVFFRHIMDRDKNTELSETKSLKHQNTFKDVAMGQVDGQVVDSKTSKMLPQSKYQILNNIETAPIVLEKKCMSLEKKEYPMTFAEELKELHRVKKLNGLPTVVPTVAKKEYPTFIDELKELHRVGKLNELENSYN